MFELFAVTGLQNVYTPLPFKVHLFFCIIATALYILQYTRKKAPHYLLIMLAIDATFVTQLCTKSFIIAALFAVEVLLLTLAGITSHKYNKQHKAVAKVDKNDEKTDGSES